MNRRNIELLAAEVQTTSRFVCPSCGGGSQKEESLVLTRKDTTTVLFKCHRASCDYRGAVTSNGSMTLVYAGNDPIAPKHPLSPMMTGLPPEVRDWLQETFELEDFTGILWESKTQRVAYPVHSPTHRLRGWVLRSYDPDIKPKTLMIRADGSEEDLMGWHYPASNKSPGSAIVVEDAVSARRIAEIGLLAVSLNGTGCSLARAAEISRNVRRVWWALDADAAKQSLRYSKEYGALFESSHVLIPEKDYKDMTHMMLLRSLGRLLGE